MPVITVRSSTGMLLGRPTLTEITRAEALVRIDPENKLAVATLVGLLKDANSETRIKAVEVLAQTAAQAKATEPALSAWVE